MGSTMTVLLRLGATTEWAGASLPHQCPPIYW